MGHDYHHHQMGIQMLTNSTRTIKGSMGQDNVLYCSFKFTKLHGNVHGCLNMELSNSFLFKYEVYWSFSDGFPGGCKLHSETQFL